MKIAFTGASSTGKTSLARALQEKILNLEYITVDARKIIDSLKYSNIDDLNHEEFLYFQKKWLDQKKNQEKKNSFFITDRTYIDSIAYMKNRDINDEILFDSCLKNMREYDLIFYLPLGRIPFDDDGYRSNNEDENKNVDVIIQRLLSDNKILNYRINMSDFDKSLDYVLSIIGDINV